MSGTRACKSCRLAKAKCDRKLPNCTRCIARRLKCSGIPSEAASGLYFKDENETARRNSERARRSTPASRSLFSSYEVHGTWKAALPTRLESTDYGSIDLHCLANAHNFPSIQEPLRKDVVTRAVDRFFVNWTLYPGRDGISLGYMHGLPTLYAASQPHSLLWLVIRAMALADMHRQGMGNTWFARAALKHYGAALQRLQELVRRGEWQSDDTTLVAVLLVDKFESIYLGRLEPLGPHLVAVNHLLQADGGEQLFERHEFQLWYEALNQLQARQLLFREEPDQQQIKWLDGLNTKTVPLHISKDVQQMNILAAAARRLMGEEQSAQVFSPDAVKQASRLKRSMLDLTNSVQEWISKVDAMWKPQLNAGSLGQVAENISSELPLPSFDCPTVLDYRDLWLAYMWNMHATAQIILRESLHQLIQHECAIRGHALSTEERRVIAEQKDAVKYLSCLIIRSFPQLMGFTLRDSRERFSAPQGLMLGRFFSLFFMTVLHDAELVPLEYQKTATEILRWIRSSHTL